MNRYYMYHIPIVSVVIYVDVPPAMITSKCITYIEFWMVAKIILNIRIFL